MLVPRQQICHLSFAASSKQVGQQSPCVENSKVLNSNRSQATVKSYQINSTPLSANKQDEHSLAEANNKENQQSNYIKIQGSTFKDYAKMQASRRGALSPMPRLIQYRQYKKSLTPGHKSREEQDKQARNEGITKIYGILNSSKNMQSFVGTGTVTHLQGSSSFKDLIQNQCRSPNRFHQNTSTYIQRKNRIYSDYVQQSFNSNPLPLPKLQSPGQDKPIPCFNNDGNNAKYRVVNKEQEGDELLYYCSKCTIPLVQQGFIVEELKLTTLGSDTRIHDQIKRISEYKIKLREKKSFIEDSQAEISSRQTEAIKSIQHYYEKIMVYLQSQRQLDIRQIQEYYSESKESYNKIIQQISSHLQILENCLSNPQRKIQSSQIETLLHKNQNFIKEITLTSIQNSELVSNFSRYFQEYLKPRIVFYNKEKKQEKDIQNQSNALRFSFEQPITNNSKKIRASSIMNPLQEEQNEEDNEIDIVEQQNSAFRTLFPTHQPENTNNSTLSPTFKNI